MNYKNILTAEQREENLIKCDICKEPTLPSLLRSLYKHNICNVCYAKKGFIKIKEVQKWIEEYKEWKKNKD